MDAGPVRPARRAVLRLLAAGSTGLVGALDGCTRTGGGVDAEGTRTTTGTDAVKHAYRYGKAGAQAADLWLPPGSVPTRTAVLVHGGFWKSGYDRSLEDAVAADLVASGWAVWNVDYRSVGGGGGWPSTFTDVADALDLFAQAASEHGLDLSRTVVAGHSAGGHLALWCAARGGLPDSAPGAVAPGRPAVLPVAVVAQAGVDDLVLADRQHLGDGAVAALLGGSSAQVPERYAVADPAQLVPLGVPLLVVVGDADDVVPPDVSESFTRAATTAGDTVDLQVVPGEDHFAHLDPRSRCWALAKEWLGHQLPLT